MSGVCCTGTQQYVILHCGRGKEKGKRKRVKEKGKADFR